MFQISLIVATYNRSAALVELLESVARQSLTGSAWECVVVNNRSTDNTEEAFKSFTERYPQLHFRLLYEEKQGLSHARNCGIRAAEGAIIAFVDDDERIHRDFLHSYVELFAMHPDCAAAGGPVVATYEEQPRPCWMSRFTEEPIANPMDWGDRVRPFPRGRIPAGGNMAFRREILARYGRFNPALGRVGERLIGGEESDLFARLRAGGEQILYTPGAVMWHLIPARKLSFDYLEALSRQIGESQRARAEMDDRLMLSRFKELLKWGATLLIALYYLCSLQKEKAKALCLLRCGISRGLFA